MSIKDLGTVRPGSTLYIEFDSFGASGESLTLTGLAVTDVEVYKNGGTTQRASDAGYALLDTDGIDFDSLTGIHGLSIDLADNTTAGFWEAGAHYRVVISSVTINAQTVSFTAATFRIGYAAAVLNTSIASLSSQTSFTLTAGPAEDDALNGMWAIIHDVASAVQFAKVLILDYTGSTKTVTLAAGATFTAAAADNFSVIDMAPLQAATIGRTLVVDSAGLADANTVKVGPTGSGTAQTAANLGSLVTLISKLVVSSGTIGATGNSTTALHLTGLPFDDDEINDLLILITDVSATEQHARWINDWANTGDLATVDTLPFTPENSVDTYVVFGIRRNVLTAAERNKIADHVKRRTQANTEASSDGDTLDLQSLYGAVQQAQEYAVSGATQTVYQTDGATSLGTRTLDTDAAADPVIGSA